MDAIVVAGGRPQPDDDLFPYTQGEPKALIKMGDRTMLERVIDALQGSSQIEEIVVIGIGHDHGMTFKRPVHHVPDQGSMVANGVAGINFLLQLNPTPRYIIGASSDIPALTSDIVDELIEACRPFQYSIYYTLVTQETMESRFPHSNRTYVRLKDLFVAGGDLFLFHTELININPTLLEALSNARKHAWKLARIVGFRTLLKFLLHRLSLEEVEKAGGRLIDGPVKTVLFPHAELAMDADKPHQVEVLQAGFIAIE
ncbi:MAG: NTP transferase domain-containing protein [Candidatus Promineifilaceae bacterium]